MVTLATLYNDFKTLIKQNFYDKGETDDLLDEKQATLVSGTNIKTVNNNSLLGSGNISISGSGTVDTALDTTSTNPVQNQAIATAIDDLETDITSLSGSITNLVQVQEVAVNMGTISSGGNATKTATVTACPTGYSSMINLKTTSWCICSASSLTGTTLSVTGMNLHSGSHTCWITVYVVYYPSSWSI